MNIFLTHLEGIGSIMEDQINAALAKGTRVEVSAPSTSTFQPPNTG